MVIDKLFSIEVEGLISNSRSCIKKKKRKEKMEYKGSIGIKIVLLTSRSDKD